MNNRIRIVNIVCLIIIVSAVSLADNFAAEIEKTSQLQPAGIIVLHASVSNSASTVKWEVTSYTVDENTGVITNQQAIFEDQRDSVRILLVKAVGKYTFYKVSVSENEIKDSIEFQVLNKGVVDKYLYKNPAIPSKPIPVYVILPTNFSADSKFLMSMHGTNRNADDYASAWKVFANKYNYVIAAPEFSSTDWTTSGYILGNMFTGANGSGNLNPKELWSFYIVQLIHTELVEVCGLKNQYYTLWGHSAGAQFVHRLALFCPDRYVSMYISADAGWYTAPDPGVIYPWGVQHDLLNLNENDLFALSEKNMVLMRGTADTLRDSNLNTEPLSDAQGLNRYERAGYYYNKVKEINSDLEWPLIDVPDVGHDYIKMAEAAGEYIINGVISSAEDESEKIPEGFGIYNYPNPFNASTQIVFELSESSRTELSVFNILGEKIITLADEFMEAGVQVRRFDASGLVSGVYLCRLSNGQRSAVSKILLLK